MPEEYKGDRMQFEQDSFAKNLDPTVDRMFDYKRYNNKYNRDSVFDTDGPITDSYIQRATDPKQKIGVGYNAYMDVQQFINRCDNLQKAKHLNNNRARRLNENRLASNSKEETWECHQCSLINSVSVATCTVCENPRVASTINYGNFVSSSGSNGMFLFYVPSIQLLIMKQQNLNQQISA